uniref:BED-type domain-containing protein n=1 Tax=Oryza punctata TaxID=4537 RepID=A0A0E0MBL6_ORYPU
MDRVLSYLWAFTAKEEETYPGENEERQQILQFVTEEKQPEISELPGGGIQVHREINTAVVELIEQEALGELEQLVGAQLEAPEDNQNPAEFGGFSGTTSLGGSSAAADAPPRDIYVAHPEIVILLMAQEYLRLRRSGNAAAAMRCYHDKVEAVYSGDTASAFVNLWREDEATTHMENTCQAIHDYLKLYFPAYRPQIGGKFRGHQVSRVWEFGERLGKDGCRCLACHKKIKGFTVTNLQNHLQGWVKRQGIIQCPAINEYILSRLQQILKERNQKKAHQPELGHPFKNKEDDDDGPDRIFFDIF